MEQTGFPSFPSGLWRRIVIQPGPGWTGGALEDDMHRFHLRIDHTVGAITAMQARAVRHPWSACVDAAPHICAELEGEKLADVAARDPAQQCTHLFDLAILCAAHAGDMAPTVFDMRVADRQEDCTTATLHQNGEEMLRWMLRGTIIEGSERFAGRNIKRVSQWKREYSPQEAEWATLLRRAIFISGGRVYMPQMDKRAVEMATGRMGVCYNYQLPQAEQSTPIFRNRDFSVSGHEPLEGFDAAAELGCLI